MVPILLIFYAAFGRRLARSVPEYTFQDMVMAYVIGIPLGILLAGVLALFLHVVLGWPLNL